MFQIRQDHMTAFARASFEEFEDFMVAHVKEFFPRQAAVLKEPRLREDIRYGVERAAAYGIVEEPDVCLYIDLMVQMGRDFDKDPRHPWAAAVLQDEQRKDPTVKTNDLYELAVEKLYPQ